jgi:hypothetical protein
MLNPMQIPLRSKADISGCPSGVRFTPKSGHSVVFEECPLRAISGHAVPAASTGISEEHRSARQNNPDFSELAQLRIDFD